MVFLELVLIFAIYYVLVRLSCGFTRSSTCLMGKTAIITGANSGIGYHTALNFASRGCRVIMADVADMGESKRNIIKYTSNTNIVTKKLDLASLQSVRDFATEINSTEERLDILVNNAGILASTGKKTEDGFDPVMQINFLGHFLLTHLLVGLMKKSAPSRIVFTSSIASFVHSLSVEKFKSNTNWIDKLFRYSNSKLAIIIAADIFARKLQGTGVTSNSVHPGFVRTAIYKPAYSDKQFHPFVKTPWEGCQCLVHVSVSKKLENVSGKYFLDCISFPKPWAAYDEKFCARIWEASECCVKLAENEKL